MFNQTKMRIVCVSLIMMLASCSCGNAITLEIDPAGRVIEFGQMNPGEFKELPESGYWHALVIKNSVSAPWSVSVSYDGVLRDGTHYIPSSVFGWMATYAGAKDAPYDNYSDGLISLAYRPFYESGEVFFASVNSSKLVTAGHITTPSGAEIQLKYFLSVPDSQLAGTYTTKITYTVTQ